MQLEASPCNKHRSLQVAPELEATAGREDLTELHRAMLQQTVREFIELGKQLPCEYVAHNTWQVMTAAGLFAYTQHVTTCDHM